MIRKFKKLLLSSLARQLIVGIAAVHAVLMTIFVFDLVDRQRNFMLYQSNQQAIGLAATLATNGSSWILANDLVGIEEIISSQSHYPELEYAMFIDLKGKVLGYSDRSKTGLYISDDVSKKILNGKAEIKTIYESNALIDIAAPVLVNDKVIGWARVGISRQSMTNNLKLVTKDGLIYTSLAIFIGILFAWAMARSLTRGIRNLKDAIDKISEGSRDVICELNRHDELEELCHDFNKMLITLREHEDNIIISHKALNKSERRFAKLIDNLRTEYIFYSHDVNGIFTYVSPSITDVLGYSEEEYLQKYDTFYTDNPLNKEAIRQTNLLLEGEVISPYEVEVYHKDGRIRRMAVTESSVTNKKGKITAIEGIARDITEIKYASEKIQNEKDNFEREHLLLNSIVNSIPDQIYYKTIDGRYLGSNKSFNESIGLSENEMRHRHDSDLFSHDKYLEHLEIEAEINKTGHEVHREEVMSSESGIQHILNTVYTDFKNTKGERGGYIYISRDVSDAKNQEQQLRRSQRLDALGKLTGGVAHDYNNLLGIVIGYAELLSMECDNEKLKNFANEILKAGNRGVNLTKKLLAFTKSQNSSSSSVNINTLLNSDLVMLQKTLTAIIDIKYDFDENLWDTWIDAAEFLDSILNISINAMHAMPDGGQLIFTTRNISLSKIEAMTKQLSPGEYVRISISDSGCGMTESVKDQLFDPFFTTKGEKGSGLGLSQVFGFISRSQGYISVYSELGKGSTFNIYLKRYCDETIATTPDTLDTDISVSGKGQRILVVDDEPALKELATHILSGNGYIVFDADNARSALDCLKKEKIDLILSDVIMPDVDGYELASIVRDNYPGVKIILASGFTKFESQKPELQDLTENMLHKPYTTTDLLAAISDLLS